MAYEQEHPLVNGASNNTTATQDSLGGGWMSASLSSSADVDYFKVTTTSAALLKIELNNSLLTATNYWNLALLNSSGDYVTRLISTVSGTPTVDGTNTGTTLAVTGLTSAVPAGSRFTFATSSADTTIYMVTSATALSSGNSTLTLDQSLPGSLAASTALVFDPAQSLAAGGLTTLTGQVSAAGTYFVKVSSASWSDAEYSVRATVLPTIESTGDNDTKAAAIPSSTTDQNRPLENARMTGNLSGANDVDFWVFSTAAMPGDISIDFAAASGDNNAPEWDIKLTQWTGDQPLTTVQGVGISATAGASKTFTIEAAKYSTANTYVIQVLKPSGVSVDTGAYTLRVRGDTLDMNDTPIITIDSVTSTRPYDVVTTGVSRSVKAGVDSKVALSTLFSVSDADAGQTIASYKVALSKASGELGSVAGSIALIESNGTTSATYAMNSTVTLTAADMAKAYLLPGTVTGNLSLALQAFDSSGALDSSDASSVMVQTLRVVSSAVGVTSTNDGTLSLVEGNGSSESLGFVLGAAPTQDVKVYLEQDGNNRFSFDKSVLTFTSANYATAQTVIATARDNQITEGSHNGQISFRVVSLDSQYDGYTITPMTVAIADPANNLPTGSLTITGAASATQGQTLSAVSTTLADADGMGTVTYQWSAASTAISGATASTYVPTQAEVGKAITVTASYTDLLGHAESVTSSVTAAVAAASSEPTPTPTPTPTPITVDGTTGSVSTSTTAGQTTTTQTFDPISSTRVDSGGSANSTLADIPLAIDSAGLTLVQVSLPVGVGVTSSSTATASGGTTQTLRQQLVSASTAHVSNADQLSEIINNGIDQFVPGVTDSSQVTVRTITLTVATGTTAAPGSPIHISGSTGAGEGDTSHPLRQEALIIDASRLPSGTVLNLDNVEFAIIIGPTTATGGLGKNYVIGDGSAQTIVLGPDDDILHGGAGNDTVGSKGGNDQLFGDEGNDTAVGGLGDDQIDGGTGNDLLVGGQSDAGQWSFKQMAGQVIMNWTPGSAELADSSGTSSSAYRDGGTAVDPRLAFAYQSTDMRETVTELYQLLLQQLPTVDEMNFWCNAGYSVAELNYGASNMLLKYALDLPVQFKIRTILTQVWGANKVTAELLQIGTDYINAGGSYGRVVEVLVKHDNFKSGLLNTDGSMTLTQSWNLADSGWSSDTGKDTLLGGAGNDTLVGGHGNDVLDGGDATDTAVWFATAANFEVQIVGSGVAKDVALFDTSSGELDIIRNIEQLQIGGVSFDSTKLESVANVEAYLATHTDHHLQVVLVGLAG